MKRSLILGGLLSFLAKAAFATTIFLTSGTTWVVPNDFGSINTIEVIGHGATGDTTCASPSITRGGGGGAYSKAVNVLLAPGATINVHFGLQSEEGAPDGVWLKTSGTVYAESGFNGAGCANPGQGGRAANGVGATKFSGGQGSLGSGGGAGIGAGGGAAGPHGDGGDAAVPSPDAVGGVGDAGFGGAGGSTAPGDGGNGTEFDASHGAGGGGGSNAAIGGGFGGLYGGGGSFNVGAPGLIVITYTPRQRVSSGVFD